MVTTDFGECKTKQLVEERGRNYGPMLGHFSTTESMYQLWVERMAECECLRDAPKDKAIRHAAHWIIDKLVRMAADPTYEDNWADIAGYAQGVLEQIIRGDSQRLTAQDIKDAERIQRQRVAEIQAKITAGMTANPFTGFKDKKNA